MNIIGRAKTPWHLWVVGVLTLLWNSVGGFSYTMTRLGLLESLGMSETEIAFFESHPVWANTFWAMGVWGAIAGSILILLRSRYAVHATVIAIIGLIGTTIFQYAMIEVPESLQSPALTIMIWVTTLFMLIYASRMTQNGVLR
ncbi:hypothetical protein NAP1_01205 [Erythrobacter sp. NAP1]|uniref:hypothetical protein n=1 Tax=Erythrobacter sp. NAP1 TaxID=237727 RepID=UPI0000686F5C|nr:hypothetical protein [Erythrobacter sp. NAP1]EAQ29347.1 hypothetical protein NAP1_01205 [Erythrobacter sp. NAP1]